jgi:sugar lactone lactonase YvrE
MKLRQGIALGVTLLAAELLAAADADAASSPEPPVLRPHEIRVLNDDADFAEGPIWYRGKLYYVEYDRNAVMVWDGTANRVFSADPGCGQSAVVPTRSGEFLTTCYDNGSIGRIAADGAVLPAYTHDAAGQPFLGPNDLAPDGRGGVFFTASGHLGPVIDGKVFYLSAAQTIHEVAANLHNANGLAVSKDGKMLYVVETEEHRLLSFRIGADGALSQRRVFVDLDALVEHAAPIWPDGVKISSNGELYIGESPRDLSQPLLGRIFVLDAQGHWLRSLQLPSPKVPNLAFSPDERTLYVMALDQIDRPPHHGKVYAVSNDGAAHDRAANDGAAHDRADFARRAPAR